MPTFGFRAASFLVVACTQGLSSPSHAPIMEKGRDIRPLIEAQERQNAEAERKAAAAREFRERVRRELSLDAPGSECVAYDPMPGSCLVTVRQFNISLENRDFAGNDSGSVRLGPEKVEALRGAALREILADRYADAPLLADSVRDSLERAFEAARRQRTNAFVERIGKDSLRALYRRNFSALFQGREERQYQILASSDSAAADSLARAPGVTWERLGEKDLPAEARGPARGLNAGETAGPIETPFARLYVRLVSARRFPDVPFEKALPVLIAMRAETGAEAVPEYLEKEYYDTHKSDFREPDTAVFRAWLLPGRARNGSLRERVREDTARIKPRSIDPTRLPACVREGLDHRSLARTGAFSGPIRSVLGTWYLQVAEIRPGGRVLSFPEARSRILELLRGSAETGEHARAREEAASKDRDLWKSVADPYLTNAQALDARNEWMHKQLSIRFIQLPQADPLGIGKP